MTVAHLPALAVVGARDATVERRMAVSSERFARLVVPRLAALLPILSPHQVEHVDAASFRVLDRKAGIDWIAEDPHDPRGDVFGIASRVSVHDQSKPWETMTLSNRQRERLLRDHPVRGSLEPALYVHAYVSVDASGDSFHHAWVALADRLAEVVREGTAVSRVGYDDRQFWSIECLAVRGPGILRIPDPSLSALLGGPQRAPSGS